MDFLQFLQPLSLAAIVLFMMFCKVLFSWWILPNLALRKLRVNGFSGPKPSFPLGNLNHAKKIKNDFSSSSTSVITHDIHSIAFPCFSQWQKLYGKVYSFWLGTQPFLYIADPEFIKRMSAGRMGKSWGKPDVFKSDRKPLFGNGLLMVEGDDWVRQRHVITPAFSPPNLKAMSSLMIESATNMLHRWTTMINSGNPEIDVEGELTHTAGEIIAKASFGISYENGQKVFEKLRAMQITLFNTSRNVGVPFSEYVQPKQTLKATRLGKEIDALLLSIIDARKRLENGGHPRQDLLSLLLAQNGENGNRNKLLTTRDLVDECKTFFFGGHETTALALTWTMLLLAIHPEWQTQLREEVKQVIGDYDRELDVTMLNGLNKMGWVMNEVLRLYPSAPSVHRQAREDIRVGDHHHHQVIPKGTNMWIDVVSMHHDKQLWGEDANEFRPERFEQDIHGGCNHKMGFLPFGFGGRMCIGRNLSMMEYKIVLTLILTRFSFSLSTNYSHCPNILLSLRPGQGLPLILKPL